MAEASTSPQKFYTETKPVPWHDEVTFFTKRWIPKGLVSPRALIIFLHGFAEHIERYDHVWPLFVAHGFEVLGYDQRGFGKTGPTYGDTTMEQQVADLEYAIRTERKSLDERFDGKQVPIYLYGHSMGGGIILSFLTRNQDAKGKSEHIGTQVSGVICGAPWILRTNPPSNLVLWLVPWISWIYPNLPFKKTLSPHHLTSDPEAAAAIKADPLFRGDIFIKTISGLLLEGYRVLSDGYKAWPTDLPILIAHGEKDPSTSPEASRQFIEKLDVSDKEFKLWPDMLHEGHNERSELRVPFLDYSLSWLDKRAPAPKNSV